MSSPAEPSVFTPGGSVVIIFVPDSSFLGMIGMSFYQTDNCGIYTLRQLPSDKTI